MSNQTEKLEQSVTNYHPLHLIIKDFSMIFTLEPSISIEISGQLPDISEFYKACRTTHLPLYIIDALYVVAYSVTVS